MRFRRYAIIDYWQLTVTLHRCALHDMVVMHAGAVRPSVKLCYSCWRYLRDSFTAEKKNIVFSKIVRCLELLEARDRTERTYMCTT